MPVGSIKVIAVGLDLEIQKRQQVFPENEGLIFGGQVNSDVPDRRFHGVTLP
jgi:hypothetical protein